MCHGFNHFSGLLHRFVLAKLATSSIKGLIYLMRHLTVNKYIPTATQKDVTTLVIYLKGKHFLEYTCMMEDIVKYPTNIATRNILGMYAYSANCEDSYSALSRNSSRTCHSRKRPWG